MFRSIFKATPAALFAAAVFLTTLAAVGEGDDVNIGEIKKQLESGKREQISAALTTLGDAEEPPKAAAPHVEKFLQGGSAPDLLTKALKVVGSLGQKSSSASVAPYARHRAPDVRRAAVKALLKTKGPDAVKALRRSLRSKDAVVRGTAASGLGSLDAKEALPDLFSAFDHRVGEAAASIGLLCDPADCDKFAARLGKFPFDVMVGGLEQILFRPPKQMPDDEKIKLVGRLRELGTPEAGNFLADVAERWPKKWSKRVKQAIDQAAKQTGGSADDEEDE